MEKEKWETVFNAVKVSWLLGADVEYAHKITRNANGNILILAIANTVSSLSEALF